MLGIDLHSLCCCIRTIGMAKEEEETKEAKDDYTLQDWQIQQLIEDIEKEGGRKADNGRLIYDANPSIYGTQGSTKRKAFRSLKNNFRRQSIQTYWSNSIVGRQVQPHPITLAEYQAFTSLAKTKQMDLNIKGDDNSWADEVHPDDANVDAMDSGVRFKKIDEVVGAAQPLPPPNTATPPRVLPPAATRIQSPPPRVIPTYKKTTPKREMGKAFHSEASTEDSFVDAFSMMDLSSGGDLPYGDGSLDRPIYVLANTRFPERNHGFCIHAFPNMICEKKMTRNIIEISHESSLSDLEGKYRCGVCRPL